MAEAPDGPVHLLPCLMQLYPDIPLLHEEDRFDPTADEGREAWVLAGQKVYLWRPASGDQGAGTLWHHRDPVRLLEQHLLLAEGRGPS